jgi:DNA (cytosine-5)-methyltransferase 1
MSNQNEYPDLVGVTRAQLKMFDVPWIIENVPNAPLRNDVTLCGSMFGLGVRRHRIFEASFPIRTPPPCDHSVPIVGVYGNNAGEGIAKARVAMDIPWMTRAFDIVEAIPPAYTEWLGEDLLASHRANASVTPTGS